MAGSINKLKMSDLEEDITDSTTCDKVRYCSNCKQPLRVTMGPQEETVNTKLLNIFRLQQAKIFSH